jgi:hypothetical protein
MVKLTGLLAFQVEWTEDEDERLVQLHRQFGSK